MYDAQARKEFLKECGYEPRATAWRFDVAAEELNGKLASERYEPGESYQCIVSSSALRFEPSSSSPIETQILFGELFTVFDFDKSSEFAWGRAEQDGHVGFVCLSDFSKRLQVPTHWVSVPFTQVLPRPDRQAEPTIFLAMNSRVTVYETDANDPIYVRIGEGMWLFERDIRLLGDWFVDPVTPIKPFANVSTYTWGYRNGFGYDCSSLIQAGWFAAGIRCPRDADQQEHEESLGDPIPFDESLSNLKAGDQVFWPGHVVVMVDEERAIHAKGSETRRTVIQPITEIRAWRLDEFGDPIRCIKRKS